MSCASWTQANAAAAPTADGRRRLSLLQPASDRSSPGAGGPTRGWRVKRATILILRSLDRRTLHDIGIDPSEIEFLVYDAGRERRRRQDAARSWSSGGA